MVWRPAFKKQKEAKKPEMIGAEAESSIYLAEGPSRAMEPL